jgi:heme/copper-type cytochrome/quinol oxidase subunit 3
MEAGALNKLYAAPSVRPQGLIEPAKLGLLLFIAMEIMFFAGIISAFLVFRLSPVPWPPAGQPRLPVGVTAANTLVLLISGFCFYFSFRELKKGNQSAFRRLLGATAVLGAFFLAVQGAEWVRLLKFGLTIHSSVYGGFFYVLVGLHGLHVAGGLSVLFWVGARTLKGAYNAGNLLEVYLCRTYWLFVVALWPVLFTLIYF